MSKNHADRHCRDSRSAGFTLIEVVVALAVAALGLGLLMAAAGTGLTNATIADQYIEATRRAQSHLAELTAMTTLQPGQQSGDDGGGYSWRVRISEPLVHAAASAPGAQMPPGLYTVEVSMSWRSGVTTRSVSLQSQRLGQAAGGDG